MELFNLLDTSISVFGQTYDVSLNWIGQLIRWLCNGVGIVGVGIILFSLILKLITLPFDVFQRISMRKQNIQMKANQEKMEKLQKQYANDKDAYNRKLMEMYKENGISILSSCLPLILSMVIFIVAINAFNAYAQYSNIENYNTMIEAYNGEMKQYTTVLTEDNYDDLVTETDVDGNVVRYKIEDDTAGKFVYYEVVLEKSKTPDYAEMTKTDKMSYIESYPDKVYFVDEDRAVLESAEIAAYVAENSSVPKGEAVADYLESQAKAAVQEAYDSKVKKNTKFLWIKNIWVTDASYKHPVLSAEDFKTEAKREEFKVGDKEVKYSAIKAYTNAYNEDTYKKVTENLTVQKKAANGYFVLIALSIGTILLQQFVMQRSQKEQQKFSSVDGSAASQQKITMIVMTGMFAVFSFMYSSAFSIYMIMSNVLSMLSTFVINFAVDKKEARKEAKAAAVKMNNPTAARIEKAKAAGRQAAQESKKKNK